MAVRALDMLWGWLDSENANHGKRVYGDVGGLSVNVI